MADKVYKQVGCLDVEPSLHCAFQARAETEDELLKHVANHAGHVHGLNPVPPELAAKVKSKIKDVKVDV
jgi:predicted small metal-binding protein